MAIDVELAGLKAAGTYRFEKDLSTLSSDNVTEGYSNLRLIVGFSKKGPFNSVQLITSASQFIKLYGNIDRSLEKRGSYFHRSALAALSAGPILCLNLLNLELDTDAHQVMHRSFSTNVCEPNANICSLPYQTLYNTDKFWYLSSDSYLDSVSKHREDSETKNENILNFTNVGNKPISILVKKATGKNIKGYEISLKEWYGAENVPEYLNGSSLVSDYMVEVYVIGGNFGPELEKKYNETTKTYIYEDVCFSDIQDSDSDSDSDYTIPYQKFASDIVYKDYFDEYGFKADKLNKFLKLPSVNVIASYVGSLIPNFTNKLNQNIWIEDIVNKDTLVTGLLCSENVELIESAYVDNNGVVDESIDIIGHNTFNNINLFKEVSFDVLSYGVSLERKTEIDTYFKMLNVEKITDEVLNNTFIDKDGTKIPINKNTKNIVIVQKNTSREKKPKIGDLFVSYYNYDNGKYISRLDAKVIDVKPLFKCEKSNSDSDSDSDFLIVPDSMSYMIEFSNDVFVENDSIYKISTIDDYCDRYHWTYLGGFKVSENSMPDGTNERQNKILEMISETNDNSNLYKALIDRDYIQWRYVIDSMGPYPPIAALRQ